ncbi:virion structural protein [Erwinia phage Machina]|uniref:Putative virion structural protein n=2 Tax=Machinavirus machina TaxID=2169990 RepID=A0A1B2ID78_9CAUD|nr:virion structural protein [Erwinia phage vB_EamM_Huxley]YP_009617072.1 virion structural protein [Erwinia phage Machina]ANZ49237.1 putative virion structural protein [Erwinia phage vB_EamM_Huxley]ANZ49793.1 putative virion structural protein [Erwinia phage Machina]
MLFYSKEAALLVYDQVNRDNPDLVVELTPAIAALTSGPTVVSSNGRNTKAVFTGFPGSGLQGNVTLFYDRINLSTLFNFVPKVYMPDTVRNYRDALPVINEALGLSLTANDITTPDALLTQSSAAPQSGKITIVGNCPAFTGAISFTYMLEGAGFYPDSGPGPKTLLQGDSLRGYFGVVDSAELFTHKAIIDAVFLKGTKPVLSPGTEGWHKFFYQGRVLYFPVSAIGYTIAWQTLYGEGLVYGVDGPGPYPSGTPVDQGRIIAADSVSEGRFYYRCRLPSLGKDPVSATNLLPATEYAGSELEMFNYLYNGKWAALRGAAWTVYIMTQASVVGTLTNHKVITGSLAASTNIPKTMASTSYTWFPVLELVDKNGTTLGLEEIKGNVDHTLYPILFDTTNTMELHPVVLGNPRTVEFAPVLFSADNSMALHPVTLGLPKTVDFTPITFTAELYTPPES